MDARQSLAALLLALTAAVAGVEAQSRPSPRVADDVARSVSTHSQLTIFDDVSARVSEGTVTLSGKVTAEYKKDGVARVVGRIDGVRAVQNRIAVLPSSPFDDELRYRVARAIYGNAAFWRYANMPKPPIHVIVEHGRVTLTGVVSTEAERSLARSLATGLGELSVTNELRTESAFAGR